MQKYRHGWSDTSFNNLLCMLPDTIPEGNKVAANTYRANRMIRPVVMKLKIFHASTNHCILYLGQYGNLQSCPHCGTSQNKRNAGYRTDVDDEGPKRRQKKKKTTTKQTLFSKDEEEEGYMQRRSLSVWYLPVIDRLRAIFKNTDDGNLMSWHASAEHIKGNGKLRHPSDGKQWKNFNAKIAKEFEYCLR